MLLKLGHGGPVDRPVEHAHVFVREKTSGPDRLWIGPRAGHVNLLLDLASSWTSPCWILYVLLVPRLEKREPGRYQSPAALAFDQVRAFCTRFQTFLETDARHHLWIACESGELLVFDNHQWIFAYGDLDAYESTLVKHGLRSGAISLPAPHTHYYHAEFDADEDELMEYWPWSRTPLHKDDDP